MKYRWGIFNLGLTLSNQQKYEDAEAAYRRSIDLGLKSGDVHYNLAMSLIGQNRAAEAEQELIKTVALDPKNTNAHYMA